MGQTTLTAEQEVSKKAAAVPAAHARAALVPVAVSMIAGIVAGRYLPLPTVFWAIAAAILLVLAAVLLGRKDLRLPCHIAMAIAIACGGAVHLRQAYFSVSRDHIVNYTGQEPILATIRGQIVTSPIIYEDPQAAFLQPPRTAMIVEVDGIKSGSLWLDASGLVRVSVKEPAPHLAAGQHVELVGIIGQYRPSDNPGQLDSLEFARLNRTLVWVTVPSAEGAIILDQTGQGWLEKMFWRLRSASRQHLQAMGEQQDGQLLDALVIGERSPALSSFSRLMMKAGVAHFLSISGSHLAVFLGFIYLLCRLLTLPPRRAAIMVLLILITYMLLAEPQAPLFRSAIMAGCLCLSTIFQRRSSPLNALAASAVIVFAFDPLQAFSAGTQLSFAIVAGLILLQRPIRQLIFGRWIIRRGLTIFRHHGRTRRWLSFTAANWAMNMVAMTLAANLVSIPLVAYHFGMFSPYAGLLSLLLSPVILAVLVPGYMSIALAAVAGNLSAWLGSLAAAAVSLLAAAVEWMQHLPGLCLQMLPVSAGWTILALVLLVCLVFVRQIRMGVVVASAGGLVFVVLTILSQLPQGSSDSAELHLLAVGAGQCGILRTPSGQTFFIDAGSRSESAVYVNVIQPFLRSQRLRTPVSAIISHANFDHFSGLSELASSGALRRAWLGESFAAAGAGLEVDGAALRLVQDLERSGAEINRLHRGQRLKLDAMTEVEVLYPSQGQHLASENDHSLVLRLTCCGRSVLLPGDLGAAGQGSLAKEAKLLKSDVLILPHHGSYEKTLPAFVAACSPSVIIQSNWKQPFQAGDRSPAGVFMAGLGESSRFYSTAYKGWICVKMTRDRLDVLTRR